MLIAAAVLTAHTAAQDSRAPLEGCDLSLLRTDEELAEMGINLHERCGFELFNECRPVRVFTRTQDLEAFYTPLASMDGRIRTMAERRLRAARIYDGAPNASGLLVVEVSRFDDSHLVTVAFARTVFEPVNGSWGTATTWRATDLRWRFPSYTSDSAMQVVSDGIDKFILEYLRVNESACAL